MLTEKINDVNDALSDLEQSSEFKQATTQQQVAKSHKTHQINDGDTVWDIAKKHKLSVNEILAFNGLSKSSTLRIGSSIKIPRG